MSVMILLIGLTIGASGYFAGVKVSKKSCEEKGYFVYIDEDGNKEKHKCM